MIVSLAIAALLPVGGAARSAVRPVAPGRRRFEGWLRLGGESILPPGVCWTRWNSQQVCS